MKQFNFKYTDVVSFESELEQFRMQLDSMSFYGMMFCIYFEVLEPSVIGAVGESIEKVFPDADYMGCSTSGNIVDCTLASIISVVCTVFESPSSKFMIHRFDLSADNTEAVTDSINDIIIANTWIKAVEMYFTIPENSYTKFCNGMNKISPEIQIFGGVACSDDITSSDSCVFTKSEGF
ncbi:MAG: GGDEF domain-containing protein, partial [Ruminococcus flavefaciens]|nr:GGDEF domain-containing protein [Ruminococcus flavefaciens]